MFGLITHHYMNRDRKVSGISLLFYLNKKSHLLHPSFVFIHFKCSCYVFSIQLAPRLSSMLSQIEPNGGVDTDLGTWYVGLCQPTCVNLLPGSVVIGVWRLIISVCSCGGWGMLLPQQNPFVLDNSISRYSRPSHIRTRWDQPWSGCVKFPDM